MRFESLQMPVLIAAVACFACERQRPIVDALDEPKAGADNTHPPPRAMQPTMRSNGASMTPTGSAGNPAINTPPRTPMTAAGSPASKMMDLPCLAAGELEFVVKPDASLAADTTAVELQASGGTLFFSTERRVYSVAASGGAAKLLFEDDQPMPLTRGSFDTVKRLYPRKEDVLALLGQADVVSRLVSVPKAGGAATKKLMSLSGASQSARPVFHNGKIIHQLEGGDFALRDPDTGIDTKLAHAISSQAEAYFPDGNALIVDESGLNSDSADDALQRIPLDGGMATEVVYEPAQTAPHLFGVAGGFAYFTSNLVDEIKRIPTTGGAIEKLGAHPSLARRLLSSAAGSAFVSGTTTHDSKDLEVGWLANGSSAITRPRCVAASLRPAPQITEQSVALEGTELYYAVVVDGKLAIAHHGLE